MLYRTLGRTGLRVSLLGIGTGGPSNFGQSTGVPEADIHRLVKRALDVGVNIFDTAAGYRDSEAILGRALKGVPRDGYYLATKFNPSAKRKSLSRRTWWLRLSAASPACARMPSRYCNSMVCVRSGIEP